MGKQSWKESFFSSGEREETLFPFEHAGYLDAGEKFGLLLFLEAKKNGKNAVPALFDRAGWTEGRQELSAGEVERYYLYRLSEDTLRLSGQDKQWFYERYSEGRVRYGAAWTLLLFGRGMAAGELFFQEAGKQREEKSWEYIGIRLYNRMHRLEFLSFENEEALKQVTKNVVGVCRQGELTRQSPCFMGKAGWASVSAVRPPETEGWGFSVREAEETAQTPRPLAAPAGRGMRWQI